MRDPAFHLIFAFSGENIPDSKHRRTRRTSFQIISNLFIRGKCECTQLWLRLHLPCLQRTVCRVRNVSLDVLRFSSDSHNRPHFPPTTCTAAPNEIRFYRIGRKGRHTVGHSLTMTPSGTTQITVAPTQVVLVILLFLQFSTRFSLLLLGPVRTTNSRKKTHTNTRAVESISGARACTLCVQSVGIGCGFNWICTVLFFSVNAPTLLPPTFLSKHSRNTLCNSQVFFLFVWCAATANL